MTRARGLVGSFFHSFTKDGLRVEWQGHVLSRPERGLYLVEFFSWLDGSPNGRELVSLDDMRAWIFYGTADEMAYRSRCLGGGPK